MLPYCVDCDVGVYHVYGLCLSKSGAFREIFLNLRHYCAGKYLICKRMKENTVFFGTIELISCGEFVSR